MLDMNDLSYTNTECRRFVYDMERKGFAVFNYKGRFFYEGPAITCHKHLYHEVIKHTKVQLQHDEMGKTDIVVYPVRNGNSPNVWPHNGAAV